MAKLSGKKDKVALEAVASLAKTEKVAVTPVVKKAIVDKNVGCPILGLGVNFYPSEEVRQNKALTKKSYVGKIVLVEGMEEGIIKLEVEGLTGIFKCKNTTDTTLNIIVDNSWSE